VVAATSSDSGQRCTRTVEALFSTSPMVIGWCRDDEPQAPLGDTGIDRGVLTHFPIQCDLVTLSSANHTRCGGTAFRFVRHSLSSALSGSARSPARVPLFLTGGPGGAVRAREPGTRVHFDHGSTISPTEDDPFSRGDTGNVSTWSTGAPGKSIHRGLHQDSVGRDQQSNPHPG
jgi:hypothetical protein